MKREFVEDESLAILAKKVADEKKLTFLQHARIKFILVAPYISRAVHGKCISAGDELKYFGNFDYLIEFSHDIWQEISDEVKYILMYHELLHVLPKENKSGMTFSIADHDVKDFGVILGEYGVKWFHDFKDQISARFDMSPEEKDKISL